jgi:chromosomal replication initiation ATPase DnaA
LHILRVCEATAARCEVKIECLLSRRRPFRLAEARQVAMAVLRATTLLSLLQIGRTFNRTHGAVIHACRTIGDRKETDFRVAWLVRTITADAKAPRPGIVIDASPSALELTEWL